MVMQRQTTLIRPDTWDWAWTLALLFWLAVAALCSCGCASNLCVIDAHCQAARLEREGIPARVATVNVNGCNHAVVIWERKGQGWYYDGTGSYHYSGDPEKDVPGWMRIMHGAATWVRWEDTASAEAK